MPWLCYSDHVKAWLSKDRPRIFTLGRSKNENQLAQRIQFESLYVKAVLGQEQNGKDL